MLVALDFDGTVAPIVEHYGDARLPFSARAAIVQLATRADTDVAIISGRALHDVRRLVGIDSVYYAGNHGLELEGPGIVHVQEAARGARPALDRCLPALRELSRRVPGVILEDKQLSVAIHFRLAHIAAAEIEQLVRHIAQPEQQIRVTRGKEVFELRPAVDWDKGRALHFLRRALGLDAAPCIFIGDDVTDEDAFMTLAHSGDGILVAGTPPAHTHAGSLVHSVDEVVVLLEALAHDDPDHVSHYHPPRQSASA
jgi:trehalose-phosphatase